MNWKNSSEYRLKKRNLIKFIWRLFGLLIISLFLIFDLIITINYPNAFIVPNVDKPTERLAIYYFYFTTQTNYLVLIYLFAFLFESKFKENSKPSFYILLSITIYITITMLVFWIGIISNSQERSKYGTDIYLWFKTIILNLIMPIVMILNFSLSCGRDFYSLKNHHKLYMWFILFYPCFYVVMVMVRGVLRVKQGENINTCYPYFFFNYQKYGVGVLITAIIFLLIISIGLQYLYLWINNIQYKKKHDDDKPNFPIITYPYGFKL
ncbi:Pr6Pr family membrane protein [Spiroplasma endosymbiont of Zeiraphera isertana]|uniref:Pr6Pr family membrane protein n=1 Tax=Spiroplasma endosymbiont of Zeiraphera isertana TaxID=3066313 RepID=UPI00313DDE69